MKRCNSLGGSRRYRLERVDKDADEVVIALPTADTTMVVLTRSEVELLSLLCTSLSFLEIAKELFYSDRHLRRLAKGLFAKLGVSDRTEAAFVAGREGIFELAATETRNDR